MVETWNIHVQLHMLKYSQFSGNDIHNSHNIWHCPCNFQLLRTATRLFVRRWRGSFVCNRICCIACRLQRRLGFLGLVVHISSKPKTSWQKNYLYVWTLLIWNLCSKKFTNLATHTFRYLSCGTSPSTIGSIVETFPNRTWNVRHLDCIFCDKELSFFYAFRKALWLK